MKLSRPSFLLVNVTLLFLLLGNPISRFDVINDPGSRGLQATPDSQLAPDSSGSVFLPVVMRPVPSSGFPPPANGIPRVNVPFFADEIAFEQTAVFWFGRISPTDNNVDVRVGYSSTDLFVHVAVIDRLLWYDAAPPIEMEAWDSASLYLAVDGQRGSVLDAHDFKLVGQLNWWEEDAGYQASYRGSGSGWSGASIPFTAQMGHRGNPNDNDRDSGWRLSYMIPFSSLGLSGAPAQGTVWGLAVVLHDRDDATGSPISDKSWPAGLDQESPASWGQMVFGLPAFSRAMVPSGGSVTIRHGLNGSVVEDGGIGGGTNCGDGLNYFEEWGDKNYAGIQYVNVQNQYDVADWPCFAKIYITFPLDSIPPGKQIDYATLILHQIGNAGGGQYGSAPASLIQVFAISGEWDEGSLTWNNAPLASENVSQAWVDWLESYPGWPGVPRSWEVGRAVAQAYAAGQPLRLALYSADSAMHSGKYFLTSDIDEDSVEGRPTLVVNWSDP